MTAPRLETRVAVFINVQNEAGEILLQQRANSGYLDGYYDFACSGHVDAGESIQAAAVRELHEELGIIAQPEALQLVHINQAYVDRPYLNFTFRLTTWQGTPQICEPEKCTDLRYFSPANLPAQCTLNVRLNEAAGFSHKLTYSKVTPANYDELMNKSL